jgi:Ca2+-binding EF-hand superfamily protein
VAPRYPALAGGDDVSARDLEQFEAQLWLAWLEEGRPLIGNGDPDFCRKLFDLNQDGKLTSEEVLRSLAINDAVNERAERARDAVYRAFDRDGNGVVDAGEWSATLGDLGPNGEAAKKYIFARVDQLSNSDGKVRFFVLCCARAGLREGRGAGRVGVWLKQHARGGMRPAGPL